MRVIIHPDYQSTSEWVANHIASRIRSHGNGSRHFVLGLPTGSSPVGTYKELVRLHREEGLSFKNVVTFNMDEYVGLARTHPESYWTFMHRELFDHIDIPKEQVNILDGNAADLEAECDRYETKIREVGGIDLFLGGVGIDGHIAFNEPGSSLTSRTRIKTLTTDTRIANARFFDHDMERVPQRALTVGVGTVMDAREVVVIVNGHKKARALAAIVQGSVNHLWTASALQLHKRAIIACDEAACEELTVGVYRYFKDIETP
ncbi:MAG: glucosamine-6-phosphate deaminase [Candidatus Sumerlaeia bacterium]|nr:glucosamine-6-phosphate deaminase [Candidatus Sumerlaeia bacterium]